MPVRSTAPMSPVARRAEAGKRALKELQSLQEMYADSVRTRVVLVEIDNHDEVIVNPPIYLTNIDFVANGRRRVTGIIYRVGENNSFNIGVSTPEAFLGFYVIPYGVRLPGEAPPQSTNSLFGFLRGTYKTVKAAKDYATAERILKHL